MENRGSNLVWTKLKWINFILTMMYTYNLHHYLGHNILHLDYHFKDEHIYWVDFEEDKHNGIYRIKPDGTEKEHIIKVTF